MAFGDCYYDKRQFINMTSEHSALNIKDVRVSAEYDQVGVRMAVKNSAVIYPSPVCVCLVCSRMSLSCNWFNTLDLDYSDFDLAVSLSLYRANPYFTMWSL